MKFIILAHQRTGTHLLATALNSHPDIVCLGEEGEEIDIKKGASVRGKIVMYNQLHGKFEDNFGLRIIHLLRDPRDTAISDILNDRDKAENENHDAHYYKKEPIKYHNIEKGFLQYKTDIINRYMWEVQKALPQSIPTIEVRYEELTKGKEVRRIPKKPAERILHFLGVKYRTLTTDLFKSPNKIK